MNHHKTNDNKSLAHMHICILRNFFDTLLIALIMAFVKLLDVVALTISLEELQPSDKILLDPVSAREWCDKVLSIRQAVEVMMSTGRFQVNTEMNACYGDKAKMMIGRCR